MMSMEYLLEEAKDLGLPLNKKRAIVREYVQNILLASIYRKRKGHRLYFMGGTALRYCYRLPRFSEDLDFNTEKMSFEEFREMAQDAADQAQLEGFRTQTKYERRNTLFTAEIGFPEVMKDYGVTDMRGIGLMVKLEVNRPDWPQKTQAQVLSYYGLNYTATVMSEQNLITEKLLALLNRDMGRDVYDLLFMLRRKFPFDPEILKANGYTDPPEKLITDHLEKKGTKELRRLAKKVQPFLFREEDVILVEKAAEYAEKFLGKQEKSDPLF
ncbi:MAG: nucleotidyl transferase AbiEii/AbiGii toxin family protein [Candidatus Altiarchaeota archaeon]|nr:nucleotidyl transferase AbiEii/AbiGii toxin family protein [Candidatus Altiarchaeota archaeon]